MIHGYVPHKSDCICVKCEDKRKDNSMTCKKYHNSWCAAVSTKTGDCHCQMTGKPTYTAGDRVTKVLTERDAEQLNDGGWAPIHPETVENHEPVKTMAGHVSFVKWGDGHRLMVEPSEAMETIARMKITFNPHTKEASIEVVP